MNYEIEFDQTKLSVDLNKARKIKIFVFGYGAVGTNIIDQFVRFGFNQFAIIDKDIFVSVAPRDKVSRVVSF